MTAPDKIYVREYPQGLNQMWSSVKATETSAIAQYEYIRKDALIEKIDEILNAKPDGGLAVDIAAQAFVDIKKVINSM